MILPITVQVILALVTLGTNKTNPLSHVESIVVMLGSFSQVGLPANNLNKEPTIWQHGARPPPISLIMNST